MPTLLRDYCPQISYKLGTKIVINNAIGNQSNQQVIHWIHLIKGIDNCRCCIRSLGLSIPTYLVQINMFWKANQQLYFSESSFPLSHAIRACILNNKLKIS